MNEQSPRNKTVRWANTNNLNSAIDIQMAATLFNILMPDGPLLLRSLKAPFNFPSRLVLSFPSVDLRRRKTSAAVSHYDSWFPAQRVRGETGPQHPHMHNPSHDTFQ